MAELNVGVVGCGRMGKIRLHGCRDAEARILAVIDPDLDRARAAIEDLGLRIPVVTASSEDLPWSELDAVFVCTPPGLRGPVELAAVSSNTALFAEKPVGLSVEAVRKVCEALEAHPVVNAVGYMNRYRPSVLEAKKQASQVPVLAFSGTWVGGRYNVPWWSRVQDSGGPLNEQSAHLADLARFLVGEVAEVCGYAAGPGVPERAVFSLRFESGALGTLVYSCEAREKQIGVRLFTETAEIRLEGWDFQLAGLQSSSEEDRNAVFHRETRAFLKAARDRTMHEIQCSYADAVRTQKLVDAMKEAVVHA